MANVHVLDKSGAGYRLALHIPVPAGNNASGFAWSAVLLTSKLGGTTILPAGDGTGGTVSAAELTSIQAGTLYEVIDADVRPPSSATTLALINTWLDAYFVARTTEVQANVQAAYARYGMTR